MKNNWQTEKLEEVIDKVTYTNKIHSKKFLESGKYPIISQEMGLINGYWNNPEDVFKIKTPIVIFGDHTKIIKYIDFDFVLGADGVKILQPKQFLDPKYFYHVLKSINLKSLGYARHYRLLKDSLISYPDSIDEQKRIVKKLDAIFENLDKAKENTEKNLGNSKELFESYLENVLELTNSECVELGKVCKYDKEPNKKSGLPYVGLEDIESNSGRFIGSLAPKKVKSNTFHFTDDHVLYGRLRPYLNKVLLPGFEGHCSTEIFPIKPNKEISRNYLFYWLISKKIVEKINATWTGARMPRANMNEVLHFNIPVPPIKEQLKIVKKLNELSEQTEKLEENYKRKLLLLDELKKSVLVKAFAGEL
jgi:type I restriction enzyme S subunit